jgi:hypothetical protein
LSICRHELVGPAAEDLASRLEPVPQIEPLGYGSVIQAARSFGGDESFLHVVGGRLYAPYAAVRYAQELVAVAGAEGLLCAPCGPRGKACSPSSPRRTAADSPRPAACADDQRSAVCLGDIASQVLDEKKQTRRDSLHASLIA